MLVTPSAVDANGAMMPRNSTAYLIVSSQVGVFTGDEVARMGKKKRTSRNPKGSIAVPIIAGRDNRLPLGSSLCGFGSVMLS